MKGGRASSRAANRSVSSKSLTLDLICIRLREPLIARTRSLPEPVRAP
jgi:hypothetical protein